MRILLCCLIGYLLGTLNLAALISRIKNKSLRENGTGNLGATNTLLVFGKTLGALVLIADIAKSFLAVKCAGMIAPEIVWAPMATGLFAVIGHCFPFYLKFKGGKGLAAFAGLVLAYHPLLFLFLLVSGMLLMWLVNYSYILPFYASAFFTVFVAVREDTLVISLCAGLASAMIFIMHFGNFLKAMRGEDPPVRAYVKKKLFSHKKGNV